MSIFSHFRKDARTLGVLTATREKDELGQVVSTTEEGTSFVGLLIPNTKVQRDDVGDKAQVSRMKGDFVCITDQDVAVVQGDTIVDGSLKFQVLYVNVVYGWNAKISHKEYDLLLLQ